MSPINHTVIRRHLTSGPPPTNLARDMVICYSGQNPTVAVWLVTGVLEYTLKNTTQVTATPGLYLLKELTEGVPLKWEVRVKAGSKVWPLTRTDLKLAHVNA